MGYYSAGGFGPAESNWQSGEAGYNIGWGAFKKWVMKPGGPMDLEAAKRREKEMGYYNGGDWQAPMLLPSEISPGSSTSVTPALARWRAAHPGEDYPRRSNRMNVGNTRALRRAMRRVQGFAKLAKRTIAFTHHVKMKKGKRGRR